MKVSILDIRYDFLVLRGIEVIITTIKTFLCTSIPAIFPSIVTSWRENGRIRAQRHHTPSRATSHSWSGWRDTDWFNHASQTKLNNGLNLSRVPAVFAVPRQFDHKGLASKRFSSHMGGPQAHA